MYVAQVQVHLQTIVECQHGRGATHTDNKQTTATQASPLRGSKIPANPRSAANSALAKNDMDESMANHVVSSISRLKDSHYRHRYPATSNALSSGGSHSQLQEALARGGGSYWGASTFVVGREGGVLVAVVAGWPDLLQPSFCVYVYTFMRRHTLRGICPKRDVL